MKELKVQSSRVALYARAPAVAESELKRWARTKREVEGKGGGGRRGRELEVEEGQVAADDARLVKSTGMR